MATSDDEAAAFYENPAAREPVGPGRKRAADGAVRPLTRHVPIRFDADLAAAIQRVAEDDGMTTSSWVRQLVAREVRRRQSARSVTAIQTPLTHLEIFSVGEFSTMGHADGGITFEDTYRALGGDYALAGPAD
jgi:hypothetical protein